MLQQDRSALDLAFDVHPDPDEFIRAAMDARRAAVGRACCGPTISNVYVGDHPTYRMEPGLPHDGYLADFLMQTKAVIRG